MYVYAWECVCTTYSYKVNDSTCTASVNKNKYLHKQFCDFQNRTAAGIQPPGNFIA